MLIANTTYEATCPWPEGLFIQGGERGLVVARGRTYGTAFVELSPPGAFLRGEGPTLAQAEQAAWDKYQRFVSCVDGTGKHGPFDADGAGSGSGTCTQCGTRLSDVLPRSREYAAEEIACEQLLATYGPAVAVLPTWCALVDQETAIVLAQQAGRPVPPRTVPAPEPAELAAAARLSPADQLRTMIEHLGV